MRLQGAGALARSRGWHQAAFGPAMGCSDPPARVGLGCRHGAWAPASRCCGAGGRVMRGADRTDRQSGVGTVTALDRFENPLAEIFRKLSSVTSHRIHGSWRIQGFSALVVIQIARKVMLSPIPSPCRIATAPAGAGLD
jgi:hypothetical protein